MKEFLLKVARSPWYPFGLGALSFIFGLIQIWPGIVLQFIAMGILALVIQSEDSKK